MKSSYPSYLYRELCHQVMKSESLSTLRRISWFISLVCFVGHGEGKNAEAGRYRDEPGICFSKWMWQQGEGSTNQLHMCIYIYIHIYMVFRCQNEKQCWMATLGGSQILFGHAVSKTAQKQKFCVFFAMGHGISIFHGTFEGGGLV